MEIIQSFYKGSTNFDEYKKMATKDIHKRYQQKKETPKGLSTYSAEPVGEGSDFWFRM